MNSLNVALILFLGVIAVSYAFPQSGGSGGGYGHGHGKATSHQNLNQKHEKAHEIKVSNGKYKFKWDVHDDHTHDIKSHEEHRHGDSVKGQYELLEPDGHKRIVKYTSDHKTGFNAEVIREKSHYHHH